MRLLQGHCGCELKSTLKDTMSFTKKPPFVEGLTESVLQTPITMGG